MLELILPEKTRKGIKTVSFKILVTTYISEFLNLSSEIMVPNSALRYENMPECFPVDFARFLRAPFFTEHLRLLLLKFVIF